MEFNKDLYINEEVAKKYEQQRKNAILNLMGIIEMIEKEEFRKNSSVPKHWGHLSDLLHYTHQIEELYINMRGA